MEIGLKIRGIYATALTKFFLDHNLAIVQPSRTLKDNQRKIHRLQEN